MRVQNLNNIQTTMKKETSKRDIHQKSTSQMFNFSNKLRIVWKGIHSVEVATDREELLTMILTFFFAAMSWYMVYETVLLKFERGSHRVLI